MLCMLQMYRELGIVDPTSTLNRDQFTALLSNIDKGLRALPATAQVGCRCRPGLQGAGRLATIGTAPACLT